METINRSLQYKHTDHEKTPCGVQIRNGMFDYQQEFWRTTFFTYSRKEKILQQAAVCLWK